MYMRFNKELITSLIFIASFFVFTLSSYGVGKATADGDEPTKTFAQLMATSSLVGMGVSWIMTWGFITPTFEKDYIANWKAHFKK